MKEKRDRKAYMAEWRRKQGIAEHPNKVGKVGPKEKPAGQLKQEVRLSFITSDIEARGGIDTVKQKLTTAFKRITKNY